MKNKIHNSVKFWDRTASNYDREERTNSKTFLQIIDKVKDHLKKSDIVLDFGCGTGLFSNEVARIVKKVDGIDISSKMIEIAKAKAEEQKLLNVEYEHTTIFDDSLKSGSYDAILSFYVLHLLEDPGEAIRKMYQLLKPGGILISVTPCMGEKPIFKGLFSILSRIGLVPPIISFKSEDLELLLKNESFENTESKLLSDTSNQYFIVSRKQI